MAVAPSSLSPQILPANAVRMSFAEYIAFERGSASKHHFHYGRLIEVAGASYEHNVICANLIAAFVIAFDDTDCRALGSDQKIYVSQNAGYYPDVLVTCGEPLITAGEALQNPMVIAEVLSPSTAAFDRGEKFRQYRTIASLRHVLFIEQDSPIIEHYLKDSDGAWKVGGECDALDQTLELIVDDKAIVLPLSKIYRNIVFPAPAISRSGETTQE